MSCFAIDTSVPELTELARFFAAQTNDSPEHIHARLQWQMGNPSRTPDVPFAWCVRTTCGTLAGAMLCIPHRLIRGSQQCTALMSSGFYVDMAFRGAGMGLFLKYRAMSERYVLYATTANAEAARLWRLAGAKPLAETDYELLRPIRWSSVTEEMLVRRLGSYSGPLVRAVAPFANIRSVVSRGVSKGELTVVHYPEDAVITSMGEGLQPVRDAAFLRWRFFDVPHADAQIYRYRQENLGADGFVALTRLRRGYRRQIRTLFLADMWGTIPARALPDLLNAISSQCRRTDDMLAIRCLGQSYLPEALAASCVRREYGLTTGWYIDQLAMLGPDPVLIPAAATELV